MNYSEKLSRNFKQTPGKQFVLNPAIKRNIPKAKVNEKILDLGCGNGYFYHYLKHKGYKYTGVDSSYNMLKQAKSNFPEAHFVKADALGISKSIKQKYHVVLANMLLLEFKSLKQVEKVVKEINKVLVKGGILVVGAPHPCFDKYMEKYLFNDPDSITDFRGYFKSPASFKVYSQTMQTYFTDNHYTIQDYCSALFKTGFKITGFDECQVEKSSINKVGKDFYEKRFTYPSYVLIKGEKVVSRG